MMVTIFLTLGHISKEMFGNRFKTFEFASTWLIHNEDNED